MASHLRIRALTIIAAVSLPAAMMAAPYTEAEVPRGHWAYDQVTTLAKYGVATGRPDGWFKGKKALPRRDFAETISYILGEGERLEGEGAFWAPRRKDLCLDRLVNEFRDELTAQGAEVTDIRSGLERFRRVWTDPRPHGVTAPLPGAGSRNLLPNWPENLAARHEGYQEALKEWQAGQVVLYFVPVDTPMRPEPSLDKAIPLKPVSDPTDRYSIQKALGHNAAMWRWLREKGPPDEARYGWLRSIFDLKRLAAGQKALELEPNGVTSPDGAVSLKPMHYVHGYSLQANGRDLSLDFLQVPLFWGYRGHTVRWGESASGVIRFDVEIGSARRIYAVDCRTGCVLNAR
jgi:hypothetical protein